HPVALAHLVLARPVFDDRVHVRLVWSRFPSASENVTVAAAPAPGQSAFRRARPQEPPSALPAPSPSIFSSASRAASRTSSLRSSRRARISGTAGLAGGPTSPSARATERRICLVSAPCRA